MFHLAMQKAQQYLNVVEAQPALQEMRGALDRELENFRIEAGEVALGRRVQGPGELLAEISRQLGTTPEDLGRMKRQVECRTCPECGQMTYDGKRGRCKRPTCSLHRNRGGSE